MTKCNERLTEEQKELVTKNHDLIYAYAHKNNISIDEYYDVLAIGLCKAASVFDETKGVFSTLAYKCMSNELNMCWRKIQCESDVTVLSYDAQDVRQDPDNQSAFLEIFADWQPCKNIDCSTMINDIASSLTDKERKILVLILKEHTYTEIANKLGCSPQNIAYYANNIRKNATEYLNNN